jgi:hypothetical protein
MKRITKYFSFFVVLALCFIILVFVDSSPCAAGWKTKNLGGGGEYNSIALDSSGIPHISYLDNSSPTDYALRHAFLNGRTWRTEVVDSGDVGWWSSTKVDPLGHVHIAYHADHPTYSLKYAFFDGTGWSKTLVESGGYATSIAVDGNNRPHILHITGANELKYVRYDGNTWLSETVAQDALWFGATSLALTPTGAAYVTFSDSSLPRRLYLATNVSGSWEVNYLADGRQSSLALDSLGNPHILFYSEGTGELKYMRYNGSTWITESVSVLADSPSIALDRFDHAHMSFGASEGGPDILVYSYHNGQDWFATLVKRNFGYATSIAVDNQGLPHIASRKPRGEDFSSLSYFHFPGFRLKVSRTGKGSGTVTSVPDGILCGSTCTANYIPTTTITLTAEPDPGSTFAGWTKCPSPSGNQCTIIIPEKNSTVKAKFDKVTP